MMKRLIRIALGSTLLIMGVAGLFLPILQGVLFIALGAVILSRDLLFLKRLEGWITDRYPSVGHTLERLRKKFPILNDID